LLGSALNEQGGGSGVYPPAGGTSARVRRNSPFTRQSFAKQNLGGQAPLPPRPRLGWRNFLRRAYDSFPCPALPAWKRLRNSLKYIIPFWDYTAIGYIIQISMSKSVYTKDYKEIIERLKTARIEAGLAQQEVADKLGKPQSYISKIESGERRLDVAELKKLSEVYKKPVSYFV